MKIVITGSTSPMGKAVYEHYSKEHECLGVSRSTGYDLTNAEDQNRLVSEILARDVFLNIAHIGTAQSTLLLKMGNHTKRCIHHSPPLKPQLMKSMQRRLPSK